MSFNCPRCESENTQRVANIYSSGTTSSTASTVHVLNGLSVSSGGEVGVIGGNAQGSTTTRTQTSLAAQFSPPAKQDDRLHLAWALMKGIGIGLLAVGAFNILGTIVRFLIPALSDLVFVCSLALFFFLVYKFYNAERVRSEQCKKYNATTYVEELKQWESLFYCHKCSHVFSPSDPL